MKVELRDLKQKKWFFEVEPSTTIGQLKELNATEQELTDNVNQRLIYSGKILKDDNTLESIKYIEDKSYIVCMVSKKPPPKKAKVEAAKPEEVKPKTISTETPATPSSSSTSTTSTDGVAATNNGSAFAVGQQLEVAIHNIIEMGYTRNQALLALKKAFNNPDRAVEYLLNNQIPDTPIVEEEESAASSAVATPAVRESSANDAQASSPSNAIPSTIDMNLIDGVQGEETDREGDDIMMHGINFQELLGLTEEEMVNLRNAAIESPESLIRMLQPILSNNPSLANLILSNMDEFLANLAVAGEPDLVSSPGDAAQHNAVQISITEEEDAAIKRLMELGFERHVVATAFLACDKDEMLTANFLLENAHDL